MDHRASFYHLTKQPKSQDHPTQSIKVVSPSAQVLEQAKQELKREETLIKKRQSDTNSRKRPSKRSKSKLLKDYEPDLFSD